MDMRILKSGLSGDDVFAWQHFLVRAGFALSSVDGKFGPKTTAATRKFQADHGLKADGAVGPLTLAAALKLGFNPFENEEYDKTSPLWPPKPSNLKPLVDNASRAAVFGKFQYEASPTKDNPERIRILGNWEQKNIISVPIPQVIGLKGAPKSGNVRFHRLAAGQLQDLFKAWADADLLDRLLTWDGSFVPRFIRKSTTTLSNHAFGSAFDVNCTYNPLDKEPALYGKKGCVRELVELANAHGFYWGGHFSRSDGMHFEIAELR